MHERDIQKNTKKEHGREEGHKEQQEQHIITPDGFQEWRLCGVRHRGNDLPAVIYANGAVQKWYQHGKLHRENDLPAVIQANESFQEWCQFGTTDLSQFGTDDYVNTTNNATASATATATGSLMWYQHGQLHRENDRPAVIWAKGAHYWYKNGLMHRENDQPAAIWMGETKKETRIWYQNGKMHRDTNGDLPAVIRSNGDREWYRNGKEHRENGLPACILANGTLRWFYNGTPIPNTRVRARLIQGIICANAKKIVLMFSAGFLFPQHIGMAICNY